MPRWLISLARRFGIPPRTTRKARKRTFPSPLRIEELEDRLAPSTTLVLSLTGPSYSAPGTNLTDVFSVANTGGNAANSVDVHQPVPSGLTFVSQTQVSGPTLTLTEGSGAVSDSIATLPAGDTVTVDVVFSMPSGTSNGSTFPQAAGVTTTTSLTGSSVTSGSFSTTAQLQADLAVSLTAPSTAGQDTNYSYTLTITNNGPNTAQSVTLTDTLPSWDTYVSQAQTSGSTFTLSHTGGTILDTISSLASGASASFTLTGQVGASAPVSTVLSDSAGVSSSTTDPNTANNSASASTTVVDPVTLTAPGNQSSYESKSVSLSLSAADGVSGATLSYSASSLPPGLTLNTSTGVITGTVSPGDSAAGPFTTTVTASDGTYSANQTLTWSTPNPVTITNPGTQTNTDGDSVSLSISASDAVSGATLIYDASGLPPGLTISSSTGVISGTVALGASGLGLFPVTVLATDGTYAASTLFTWHISGKITLSNPGTQTNNEGDSVSLSLSASDSTSGATLSYAATGLPGGLKINTSSGAITGTIAVGAGANGPYSVTVTAADGTNSASQTFTWNVNGPVTLAPIPDQTNNEGDSVSLALSATHSSGTTIAFGAVGLPNGLKISTSTGTISGTIASGAAAYGPFSVSVTVGDGLSSASQSFTWNVNHVLTLSAPADQSNNLGDTVSLTVSAIDPGGTPTYGAIGLPGGLSINAGSGVISGTIAATSTTGALSVTLLAGDGSYTVQTSFTWTVNSTITIATPADQSNSYGATPSLTISATDSHSGTLSYSASGLPNGLSINSGSGAISGTISGGGSFTPTVTVSDGTYSASASFNWAVGSTISISGPGSPAYAAGDAVSVPVQASDSGSGTLSYSASGLPSGLSINSSTGLISGTVSSSLSAGDYTTTVTVGDGTDSEVLPFTWTIYPTSAASVSNPGDQSSTEGDTVSLSLSASDSSSGVLRYAAEGLPPGLKINPATGAITGTVAVGDSDFAPFVTTVTASDGANSDSQSFNWDVSSPISLTDPSDQTNSEGDSVSLTLSATDSSSGTLSYAAVGLPPGLTISSSSGTISGTVAAGAAAGGPYSVIVVAYDGTYNSQQTFNWTVNGAMALTGVPSASSSGATADETNSEGDTVSLSLGSTGSSGSVVYAATGLPPGLKLNPSTGAVTGTVAVGAAANSPYSVTVAAGSGPSNASASFTWAITSPVTFTTPADQTSTEGATASLSISASDSSSGTLKYAALGLPPGLVMNPSSGAISGTLAAGDAASGPYTVTVGAGDGTYSGQTTFTWNVNSVVSLTTPADQTNNAGASVSLPVTAGDAHSSTLSYSATGLPSGLSINSSTGVISGTSSAGGSFQPSVTVSDGTYSNTTTFAWTVSSPIFLTDPGAQTNAVSDSVSLQVNATDSVSGTLSYSASGLPSGLSINSSTGLISGTVGSGAPASSPYTTTVTVGDGSHSAVDTFTWDVNAAGPIVLTSPGSQTNVAGDQVAFQVQATDSNGGTLEYSASGLPSGLSINPLTGFLLGTIASGAASGSPYSVTIKAADPSNQASQTFSWTVNTAGVVTMTNPGDQTGSEGASVSLSISASASGGGSLAYVAFGLPAGLKINTSSGAITGTVAVGDAAYGPYTVTVVAGNSSYSAAQTFQWTVTDPITVTAPADQTNNEGDSASLTISASDSTSGATLDYAAFGLPPGLAINASSGAISGTISGGASAGGPYSVTVVAEDGTSSASASFNWNINDPVSFTASGSGGSVTTTVPGTQTNTEGDSVSLTLSASNSGSGTLIYSTLDLPPGLSINPTSGAITGTVAIGDAPLSAYEPTITASNGASSDSADFEWDINGSVSITDPGNQSNTVGDSVSLQILTTYDGSGTLSYAASGLPAGLSISTSSGLISGTVGSGATAIGTYTTTVTAGDGNSTASDTFTWTITAAGTVTLTTPSDQSNSEGDSVSLSLSASGGGTLKYFAEGLPPGLKLSPSSGAITGTVALGDTATGPYNVTVSATDGTHSAGEAFNWTVTDPVTITSVPGQTGTEGGSVSVSVSASDTSGGTLAYGAIGLPPGLVINPSTGAITGTMALGAAAAGTYTVTVIAGDSTYSASQTFDWGPGSPVTITSPGDQTNTEGDTVSLSISASDSGGTVKYSAYGLPAGLHINTSSGAITGTVAPGASAQGPYTVVVTASDGTYGASVTFNWTINDPITITNPGVQDVSEGESVSLAIHASDSHGGTLSYNAVNLPLGLVINSATGVISGTISNTLAAAGAFVGRITATDGTYSNTMLVYFEEEEPKGTGKGPGKANGVPQGSINGWSIIVTVGDAEVKLGSMDIDFMVSVDSLYPLKDYEITQFVTNNTKLWDKDGKKLSTKDLYKAYRDSNISFSAGSDPLCTNSKDAGWGDGNDWLAFAGKTDQTIKDTHISNVPVYTEKGKDMYYAFEKSSTMVIKIRDKSSKKVVATYQWSYTFRNYKGNSPKAPIVDIDPVGLYDYEGIFGVPKDIDFKGK